MADILAMIFVFGLFAFGIYRLIKLIIDILPFKR